MWVNGFSFVAGSDMNFTDLQSRFVSSWKLNYNISLVHSLRCIKLKIPHTQKCFPAHTHYYRLLPFHVIVNIIDFLVYIISFFCNFCIFLDKIINNHHKIYIVEEMTMKNMIVYNKMKREIGRQNVLKWRNESMVHQERKEL